MSILLQNFQIEASSEMSPLEQYWTTNGHGPSWKWQADRRMMPMNTRGTPIQHIQGSATGLPGLRRLRMPFNQFFFGTKTFPGPHPQMSDWLKEAVRLGYRFVWCMMDGASQEAGSGGEYDHYPQMYPITPDDPNGWPVLDTLDDWQAWMAKGGPLSQRQINNFRVMLDWVDANTPDMIIDGFEAINEPVAYRRPGGKYGAQHHEHFMERYVDHVEAIWNYVEARRPGKDFYVGGWSYSTDFDSLRNIPLPSRGGKNALDAIRSFVPAGPGGRLVWSAHVYTDWFGKPANIAATEKEFDRRWSDLIRADRFVITETNFTTNAGDYRSYSTDKMLAHVGNWYHRRGVGLGWFATVNYSPSKLLTIFGNGEIHMPSQNLFAAYYNLACLADRQGDLVSSVRSGHQTLHRVHAVRGIRNDAYDPEGAADDATKYYTVGFGGRGVCVLTGHADAVNFLYGGPARTVLYGGALDDHLYLGTGGGVIRTGAGHSTCGTNGGENLIYTGSGTHIVNSFYGRSTIVCDPAGTTRIAGFDPEGGDAISFKGAFTSTAQLVAATTLQATSSRTDLVVTTPQGGKIILLGRGDLQYLLSFHTLDLTDGWYGAGWSEPADFTTAEFNLPAVALLPLEAPDDQVALPSGSVAKLKDGSLAVMRDYRGRPLDFSLAR